MAKTRFLVFVRGLKKPGFLPRLKMGIKYFGKNPVSGFCAGIQETGFFTEIKGLRFFATLRMTLIKNPVSGFCAGVKETGFFTEIKDGN